MASIGEALRQEAIIEAVQTPEIAVRVPIAPGAA